MQAIGIEKVPAVLIVPLTSRLRTIDFPFTFIIESDQTNTNALNEMLKRVQHDKIKGVIPNLFRNLKVANDNKSIAFVLIISLQGPLRRI